MATPAEIAAERRAESARGSARAASARRGPREASGGGGFEAAAPAAAGKHRVDLPARGFTADEISKLHDAAGAPRTERKSFGMNEDY